MKGSRRLRPLVLGSGLVFGRLAGALGGAIVIFATAMLFSIGTWAADVLHKLIYGKSGDA